MGSATIASPKFPHPSAESPNDDASSSNRRTYSSVQQHPSSPLATAIATAMAADCQSFRFSLDGRDDLGEEFAIGQGGDVGQSREVPGPVVALAANIATALMVDRAPSQTEVIA